MIQRALDSWMYGDNEDTTKCIPSGLGSRAEGYK
jgi:hypothetical protein